MRSGGEWMNGIKLVLSDKKYASVFAALAVAFSILFIFEWNLILIRTMYVRTDLWTPANVLFLAIVSILSSMAVTLGVYGLKARIPQYKSNYGYLAIVPAIFASACPACAPLILSFGGTTFAIGLSLAKYNVAMRVVSILALAAAVMYASSKIGASCKLKPR